MTPLCADLPGRLSRAVLTPTLAAASSSSASHDQAGEIGRISRDRPVQSRRARFFYGFAKSHKGNIKPDELAGFKKLASEFLSYGEDEVARLVNAGALTEVVCDEEAV